MATPADEERLRVLKALQVQTMERGIMAAVADVRAIKKRHRRRGEMRGNPMSRIFQEWIRGE